MPEALLPLVLDEEAVLESLSQTLHNVDVSDVVPSLNNARFARDVYRIVDSIVSGLESRSLNVHHISITFDFETTPHSWALIASDNGAVVLYAKPYIGITDIDLAINRAEEMASATEEDYEVIPAVAGYIIDFDAERYAKSIDVPIFYLDL